MVPHLSNCKSGCFPSFMAAGHLLGTIRIQVQDFCVWFPAHVLLKGAILDHTFSMCVQNFTDWIRTYTLFRYMIVNLCI